MSPGPFAVEFVIVFIGTLFVLHQYGNWRKQHWIITTAVFVSWLFSFLIVFILPLDISSTYYKQCLASKERDHWTTPLPPVNGTNTTIMPPRNHTDTLKCLEPYSFMPGEVLLDMWKIVYWSSQILSWLVLPMMQSYVYAGEFSIAGKIRTALYENAIWYGSYLVIFGALLIYVAVKPELDLDGEHLKIIGITASNTWGLLLLVLLLGYGLVELPRNAWNASLPGYGLSYAQFKISKLSTEKEDAEEELSRILKEVKKASEEIKYNSNLRGFVDTIISKCPEVSHTMFSRGTEDFVDYNEVSAGKSQLLFNEKALVKLHRQVIVLTHRAHRTQVQWNSQLKKAFDLEDLDRNRTSQDRIFKSSASSDGAPEASLFRLRLKWYWRLVLSPILYKMLAIILLVFSLCLVWSEVTFFSTDPNLSIFSLMLDSAKGDYLFLYIEIICCVTIAYMCLCTYYTVFKMRIFNYYYFAPRHQTDANSLVFSGLLLCRLTVALCLNFLALIHLDGHVTKFKPVVVVDTAFTHIMGHMDVVSFVAKGFNVYYPMTVLLVCLCTYFHLGSRILHIIGFQQFLTDDELSAEYVNEGKDILRRERRKAGRGVGSKEWSKRGDDIRQKLRSAVNPVDRHARIDDDENDAGSLIPSQAKRSSGRYKSNGGDSDDRVQLLSAVDYAPDHDASTSTTGYSSLRGATTGKNNRRNFFDDV